MKTSSPVDAAVKAARQYVSKYDETGAHSSAVRAQALAANLADGRASYDDLDAAKDLVREGTRSDTLDRAGGIESNHEADAQKVLDEVRKLIKEQGFFRTVAETFRGGEG